MSLFSSPKPQPEPSRLIGLRPALRDDLISHRVAGFESRDRGRWRALAPDALANWAQLMSVGAPESSDQALSSELPELPSPWSWPILFELALYDPLQPLHHQALSIWRACLAMLGLHECLGLSLSTESLSLNETAGWPAGLELMLPRHSLTPTASWRELVIFSLGPERELAITSPTTLICPAQDIWTLFQTARQPDTFLSDPLQEPVGPQSLTLLVWLLALHADLAQTLGLAYQEPFASYPLSLAEIFTDLLWGLIDKLSAAGELYLPDERRPEALLYGPWLDSLRRRVPELRPARYLLDDLGNPRFHFQPLYRGLGQLPFVAKISEAESPLRLLPSEGLNPHKQLLILTPELLEHADWAHRRVLREQGLRELLSEAETNTDTSWLGGQYLQQSQWVDAEALFLADLYVIPGYDSLPGCRQDILGFYNLQLEHNQVLPLLPLTPLLLDYLSPEDLARGLSFEWLDLETVELQLRLTLSGGEICLSRRYPLASARLLQHIPICRIWPGVRSPLIRRHISYTSTYGQDADAFRLRLLQGSQIVNGSTYNYDRRKVAGSGLVDMEITHSDSFPEAFACESLDASLEPESRLLGLILLEPPTELPAGRRQAEIAIDLGTTNTQALMSIQGQLEPIELEARWLYAVTASLIESRLYEDFLAPETIAFPFLTLFKLHQRPGQALPESEPSAETSPGTLEAIRPLHDGHIYFVETIHTFEADSRVKTDLKWGLQEKRLYMVAYLQQLCMQTALAALSRGANKIQFHFSYPLAFSAFDLKAFESAVARALSSLKNEFSSAIELQADFQSEGVAAAYYFAQGQPDLPPARFHQGVVILDIGGGTTDITLIEGRRNELRFTTSIKFAGRDLFMRSLLAHLDVLPLLGLPNTIVEGLKKEKRQLSLESPQLIATLDAIVHEFEDHFFRQIPFTHGMPAMLDFLTHLSLGVAGLFYHVGQIVASLQQAGNYDCRDQLPMFYVAGNGAKLFQWFQRAGSAEGNPYFQLFRQAFLLFGASAIKPGPQPLQLYASSNRQRSKPEVVQGMIQERSLLSFEGTRLQPRFIAGEAFRVEAQPETQSAMSLIEREDLLTLKPDSLRLEEAERFFEGHQKWLKSFYAPAALDATGRSRVIERVRQQLRRRMYNLQTTCRNDPKALEQLRDEQVLFIQALKGLYQEMETRHG